MPQGSYEVEETGFWAISSLLHHGSDDHSVRLVSEVWTFSLSHCLMWPQAFLCLSLLFVLVCGGWDAKPGLL